MGAKEFLAFSEPPKKICLNVVKLTTTTNINKMKKLKERNEKAAEKIRRKRWFFRFGLAKKTKDLDNKLVTALLTQCVCGYE